MDKNPIISVKNLNVTYFPGRSNEVRALKDIALDIFPGEYIIFFGPSGCGKSTLLYSLAGLERNIAGSIVVKGKDLMTMSQRDLEEYHQRTVGMIFQSYYLIASLTVAQNVALPQVAVSGPKAARLKRAVELLTGFGVGAQAAKLPMELSGGQQQRVAISRALINEPDILVADEPVGNLDSKSTKDVMDLLRKLHDEQKKTIILVTHDPSHLFHANRIFYLRDGVIINTKTNTEEERMQPTVVPGAGTGSPDSLAAALTHWVRTYAAPAPTAGKATGAGINIGRQTQEILAESLTGLSVDELLSVEEKLYAVMKGGSHDTESIYAFLHKAIEHGGVGMDKRKAKRMAGEMQSLARTIKKLSAPTTGRKKKEIGAGRAASELRTIRRFLLDRAGVHLKTLEEVALLDGIIEQRLQGKLDRRGVQKALILAVKDGGLAIAPRFARKMSQLLEPFVIYKPDAPKPGVLPADSAPPASPPTDAQQ
jgi:putative ABC transport system ATP-binding protein